MHLTFYGGAGEVTGSNFLLETKRAKILIDCGLAQGKEHADERNFADFGYNPREIDALFVTHAHIDHIGRIPRLVKAGFSGPIYSTAATRDLAKLSLEDSVGILEEEATRQGREPLYTAADIEEAMGLWHTLEYHQAVEIKDGSISLFDSGHILGSAIVAVEAEKKRLVFTGDLGNPPMPILRPPEYLDRADFVVIESAYGNRLHESRDKRHNLLERAVEDAATRGGTLMMPMFAIERAQEILFELNGLIENKRVPRLPVFVDSPFAIRATEIYKKYERFFNSEAVALIRSGDDIFNFLGLTMTLSAAESKKINAVAAPKIILAGSGMSTGGRILYHELRYLSDKKSIILFVGYQSQGTLGRRILEGAKEVEIFGERVPVRCDVRAIGGYSAHADQAGLRKFIDVLERPVEHVFVTQGEEDASQALAQVIRDQLGIMASVPTTGQKVNL